MTLKEAVDIMTSTPPGGPMLFQTRDESAASSNAKRIAAAFIFILEQQTASDVIKWSFLERFNQYTAKIGDAMYVLTVGWWGDVDINGKKIGRSTTLPAVIHAQRLRSCNDAFSLLAEGAKMGWGVAR